ncbi:MAG: NUDIX domain-containing protein [Chloroflexi bacterium]|nr:NUDIX domain-containing protein [Chloroflexota bacterium]
MTTGIDVIRPGVGALVIDRDGKILLHYRRAGGGWAPPSGGVEPGETLLEALARELREETGLTATVHRVVGVYSDPSYQIVTYPDGRKIHYVTTVFECKVESGSLAGNDEGTEWAWFLQTNLPSDLAPYARRWLSDAIRHRRESFVR